MKKIAIKIALTILAATGCGALAAFADSPPLPAAGTASAGSEKFGAGIMVGEPTGATMKYWLNESLALDGAVGWSLRRDSTLYLHSDLLWHAFDLIPVPPGRLPVYLGVGSMVRFRDDHRDDEFGVRLPVGLSYLFARSPVEVFVEVAPGFDFAPATRADITGGVGIRYRF